MTATPPKEQSASSADDENNSTHIHVSGEETASGQPVELSAEDVRQGHTGDHLRGILALSGIGAVIALIALYMFMKP